MLSSFPVATRSWTPRSRLATKCAAVAIVAAAGACALGQQAPPSQPPAQVHVRSTTAPVHHQPLHPEPRADHSAHTGDAPSQPAQVTLHDGKLTIDANNSDLGTILEKISHDSGMTIDGLDKSGRVFGVYGPGAPRDVLTELLSGSGYNFMLLGGANDTVPTQLVLTAQGSAPQPPNGKTAQPSADDSDSDANYQEPLGPGAIAHPRPQESDDIDPQTRAQQRLQNLQQMHDELDQRAQQQQNNPQ